MEIKSHLLLPPIYLSCILLLLAPSALCDKDKSAPRPITVTATHRKASPSKANTNEASLSKANTNVEGICSHTEFPDICSAIAPKTTGSASPQTVLESLIKQSEEETHATIASVSKLRERPTLPPMVAANLKVCEDSYNDALYSLEKAKKAMDSDDMPTLAINLSAALTNYDTCENGFVEMPGLSPMSKNDDKLAKLVKDGLALCDLMRKG